MSKRNQSTTANSWFNKLYEIIQTPENTKPANEQNEKLSPTVKYESDNLPIEPI